MAKAGTKKSRSKDKVDRRMGVQEAIEMGIAAIEQGNRKQAYSIFQQTADLHPNVSEVWIWLAGTSPTLESAESAFERAYTIDPDNEQASLGLRWVRLRRKASLSDIIDATSPMPMPLSMSMAMAALPEQSASVDQEPQMEADLEQSAPTDMPATDQDAQTPDEPAKSKRGLPAGRMIFAIVSIVAILIALSALFLFVHLLG